MGRREPDGAFVRRKLASRIVVYRDRIRANVPFWEDDGVMHPALETVGRMVRRGEVLGMALRW